MKIMHTLRINPKIGERRVISKFLWFPKRLNNETRWLETVKILQEYKEFEEEIPEAWATCVWGDWVSLNFVE